MKALVLGLGISGQSAQSLLKKRGVEVVAIDDRLCPQVVDDLSEFDLFVPSPGIPRTHPLYVKAKTSRLRIAGEAQLALEQINAPCIGVTGTNGKTTVVQMITHCLNVCGRSAKAVGNIGEPIGRYVHCKDEILVIELSSFQLETLSVKALDVALILNIEEDHLDRYDSFEEYAQVKKRIKECVKKAGQFFENVSNEEAAYHACAHFGIERDAFFDALSSFTKPQHRLEFVTQKAGVAYYNDSKATNVAAMLNAIETADSKAILIAGGQDKGLSFFPLSKAAKKLSCVIVFGQARKKIKDAVHNLVEVHEVETVEEAVECAKMHAKVGEVVLFSPGCASFDAFANYKERGEFFKKCVHKE